MLSHNRDAISFENGEFFIASVIFNAIFKRFLRWKTVLVWSRRAIEQKKTRKNYEGNVSASENFSFLFDALSNQS